MQITTCDVCGAPIKALLARFYSGSPAIVNERMEIIDGGDFDLCHDCAGKVAEYIHKMRKEKEAKK